MSAARELASVPGSAGSRTQGRAGRTTAATVGGATGAAPGTAAAPTGRAPATAPGHPEPDLPGHFEPDRAGHAGPSHARHPGTDSAGRPGNSLPARPDPDVAGHPEPAPHPGRGHARRVTAGVPAAPAAGEQTAPWSSDPYADALRVGRGPLYLRRTDGWLLPLEVERWCAGADAVDLEVLRRCEGAVLDVGCGPGRLIAALAAQGRRALGIDISEAAVEHTVRLGGQALHRSVFEPVPGEGRWGTALLIDGNLGIGGDPAALLDRVAQLLSPEGLLIVETVPVDVDERVRVRVADGRGAAGSPFLWARLGTPALLRHARAADWHPDAQWSTGGRSFVALRSRSTSSTAEPPNTTAVISSQLVRKPFPARPVADR